VKYAIEPENTPECQEIASENLENHPGKPKEYAL